MHLVYNIVADNVTNVIPHPLAVTKDGRRLRMYFNVGCPGGATANIRVTEGPGVLDFQVNSMTLDNILENNRIERCRLLKIDCEGSEYEILHNSRALNRIEYLSAEIHINQMLRDQGFSPDGLLDHCRKFIDKDKISVQSIRMAE